MTRVVTLIPLSLFSFNEFTNPTNSGATNISPIIVAAMGNSITAHKISTMFSMHTTLVGRVLLFIWIDI